MSTEFQNLLKSAIDDYSDRGLYDKAFLTKVHQIYNAFAHYPCPLPSAEHPYSLGIVFSYFCEYYKNDIDKYTSIIENALFCFFRVINESEFTIEKQSATIRLLLLIDKNDWVMKGIMKKFYMRYCDTLYGMPLEIHKLLHDSFEPWTFETDLLSRLGERCIEIASSDTAHSVLSQQEMQKFNELKTGEKYVSYFPLIKISTEELFRLFNDFINEFIRTPYERRITHLYYNSL